MVVGPHHRVFDGYQRKAFLADSDRSNLEMDRLVAALVIYVTSSDGLSVCLSDAPCMHPYQTVVRHTDLSISYKGVFGKLITIHFLTEVPWK